MIDVVSYTKDSFKELNREIVVYGRFYLAKKRESKNLFNSFNNIIKSSGVNYEINSNLIKVTSTTSGTWNYVAIKLDYEKIMGKTIYVKTKYNSECLNPGIYIFDYNSSNVRNSYGGTYTQLENGILQFSANIPSTMPNGTDGFALLLYANSNTSKPSGSTTTYENIMISLDNSTYEEYGTLINDYNAIYDKENLFDKNNVTNHFLNINGTTTSNANYKCSDFIELDSNVITIENAGFNNGNMVYYDSTKTQILGYYQRFGAGMTHYVLDKQAKYMKICVQNEYLDTIHVHYGVGQLSKNLLDMNYVITTSESEEKTIEIVNNVVVGQNTSSSTSIITLGQARLFDTTNYTGKNLNISYLKSGVGYIELRYGNETGPVNDEEHLIIIQLKSYKNFKLPSSLANSQYIWAIFKTSETYITYYDIQISEGEQMNVVPYERFNSAFFTFEENAQSQILSLNLNEKTDIYYSSVPANTLTIEVNNEQGYFTDYYKNNILDYLNEDCYVDINVWIKNGDEFKIARMNFNKLEYSDYEKAKLSFKSSLAFTENVDIKDKNLLFDKDYSLTFSQFKQYMLDNYNITTINNHQSFINSELTFFGEYRKYKNLRDIILSTTNKSSVGPGIMLLNDKNNDIFFKTFTNVYCETITNTMELEKPINKKEDTYRGVKYNYYNDSPKVYEQTTETYTKTITRKLQSEREILIVTDDNYKLNDITINDITSTENVSITLGNNLGNVEKILTLIIQGNIGDEYTIQILKDNMYKYVGTNLVTYNIGNITDTTKVMTIQETSVLGTLPYVFLFIKKPVKSYVEAKIMALPYLEIGDVVQIELDDKNAKIVITEIDTTYGDGLLQTIKGYELDWSHQAQGSSVYTDLNDWDSLLPQDTLLPKDNLYPY